jgi:hypothetical protein
MPKIGFWQVLGVASAIVALASILLYHSAIVSVVDGIPWIEYRTSDCYSKYPPQIYGNVCGRIMGERNRLIAVLSPLYASKAAFPLDILVQTIGLLGWLTPFKYRRYVTLASPVGLIPRVLFPSIVDLMNALAAMPEIIATDWASALSRPESVYGMQLATLLPALQEAAKNLQTFLLLAAVFFILWFVAYAMDWRATGRPKQKTLTDYV